MAGGMKPFRPNGDSDDNEEGLGMFEVCTVDPVREGLKEYSTNAKLRSLGLVKVGAPLDGNCGFWSVAHQQGRVPQAIMTSIRSRGCANRAERVPVKALRELAAGACHHHH